MVDLYEQLCVAEERKRTWTGLARFMGFCQRADIDHYLQYPEFVESVQYAKLLVEEGYEEALHRPSPAGAVFALKNMGWHDKTEVHTTEGDKPMTLAEFYGGDA